MQDMLRDWKDAGSHDVTLMLRSGTVSRMGNRKPAHKDLVLGINWLYWCKYWI